MKVNNIATAILPFLSLATAIPLSLATSPNAILPTSDAYASCYNFNVLETPSIAPSKMIVEAGCQTRTATWRVSRLPLDWCISVDTSGTLVWSGSGGFVEQCTECWTTGGMSGAPDADEGNHLKVACRCAGTDGEDVTSELDIELGLTNDGGNLSCFGAMGTRLAVAGEEDVVVS